MKPQEHLQSLMRSPELIWNILFRARYDFTYDLMPVSMRRMSMARRLNLLKAGTNFIYRRLTPWNWPLHMQIELTNYCNLRCPVCPTGIREMSRRPVAMDVGLFEHLMNEVGPYLLTASLWAWGEPLLHPQLTEILRLAREQQVVSLLSTNGQNLNDDRVIHALISYPPTYLIVAIDGLTDETNSKLRVGARLDPILSGVRRLAEIKQEKSLNLPVLHMRYIVTKHNQHEVSHLRDFAKENEFDLLTIRTLSIIDSPEQAHRELVPDAEEFRAYEYENGERVLRDDFICLRPFWFPTILADGTVVACEQDYNAQQPFGVLSDDVPFADLWFGKRAARNRKIIRDAPEGLSFCRNCPYADRPTSNECSIQVFNSN